MSTTLWRFVVLLLAALGLAMGAAHALELPVKLQFDAVAYMDINSTLYKYFGVVGGAIQVSALLTAAVLALQVRGRRSFRPTLYGTLLLALSLGLWGGLVQPVNMNWRRMLEEPRTGTTAEQIKAARQFVEQRPRWEYGHLAAFGVWALGYAFLVRSVLVELPREADIGHEEEPRRKEKRK